MNKRKGFTLIELLATVIILAVIVSITIFIASNVIKKAKEKSYQVTINEIESKANSYLMENSIRLDYILNSDDDSIEYQCVTVQNLIDYGYLSNNVVKAAVSDSETVHKEDYVYLERNANTKTITKSVYVGNIRPEYFDKCNVATKGNGNITAIYNPGLNVWSKSKEITVTYTINNLNNYNDLSKFKYRCEYKEVNDDETLSGVNKVFEGTDDGVHKTFTVDHNGNLTCTITYEDDKTVFEPVTYTEEIRKIDNIRPVITLANGTKEQVGKVIPIKVTDEGGSGVNYDSFTKEDIVLTIGGTEITDFTLKHSKDNKDIYNLTINDLTHTGEVIIIIDKDKVTDNAGNGNEITELKPGIFSLEYTITYNGNGATGGNTTPTKCNSNQDCTLADNGFTKTGYTFAGWYDAASSGNKYGEKTKITSDITVYAHWETNNYKITYNGNGATGGSTNPTTCKYNQDCTLANNGFTKTGYKFVGWYTASSGGNKYGEKTKITSDITVYAHWETNNYKITYNGNGATGGSTNQTTCNYNQDCTLANNGFTKTGYTFAGWYTASSGGNKYGKTTKITSNITVYAHWQQNKPTTIKITYDSNGGNDCNPKTKTVTYGNAYGSLCKPSKSAAKFDKNTLASYTFLGWSTTKQSSKILTATDYNPDISPLVASMFPPIQIYANQSTNFITSSSIVSINKNHTLYAVWKTNTSFGGGGNDCGCTCTMYSGDGPDSPNAECQIQKCGSC